MATAATTFTALLLTAAPASAAAHRCGRAYVPARQLSAKVRVVKGRESCPRARLLIASAFNAEAVERFSGRDATGTIYWLVRGWRCYPALADSQTGCLRGHKEVDGSFRGDDGWGF